MEIRRINNGEIFYYHTNHLGSTAFVTDNNSSITQGFVYAPFGEIISEYNATFGNEVIPKYTFNAKELDEETGMYYFEARYYRAPTFISRDPLMNEKPWLTPYHYCSNNPVGKVDPSGMSDDWYQDADGNVEWTDCKSQAEMDKAGIKGNYLGEAAVIVQGSYDEKLGEDGTLTGKGANPAEITIYGINGENDIKTYNGLSVSSDPSKYSMIASGDYKAYYQDMATSSYGSKGGSLSYRIANLDGSLKLPTEGGEINKNHPEQGAFMKGIYFHRTNNNGWAGINGNTAVSQGCIVIDASKNNWKSVEKQLGRSSNIYFRITR